MKFSICIPNFNYGQYLRLTLESVQQQADTELEICIADNNSTDDSQNVILEFAKQDGRIKYQLNPTNIGFSDNLIVASSLGAGDWHILLSSDDLILKNGLKEYQKFIELIGNSSQYAFCAACDKIDGEGRKIGYLGPRSKVWQASDLDQELSEQMGYSVYRVGAAEMMRRCLSSFYGYFNFAAACYPASAYKTSGGYFGGRMYSPDKWFHWRLLTVVDEVFYLDTPLFGYRWHAHNQSALQQKSRALKYLVDEYRNVFETTPEMLSLANLSPVQVQKFFVEEVVAKQAFAALINGLSNESSRILHFGRSTYPDLMLSSRNIWGIYLLKFLGPLGRWIAKKLRPAF